MAKGKTGSSSTRGTSNRLNEALDVNAVGGQNLFGFEILDKNKIQKQIQQDKSFALPQNDDGAVTIQTGAYFGTYVDLEGVVRNEIELITRYREMAMQPEIESAVDDIVNESICMSDTGQPVDLNTDDITGVSKNVKDKIAEEFERVLELLNFGNMGSEIYRRWYVDGRLFYHVIIDEDNTKSGIKELRYIDPRRIRKIREVQKEKDPKTGAELVKNTREYFMYNERGIIGAHSNLGIRISPDSIVNVNSGLMDSRRAMVLSYLHKAIKPLNMLRMMEDATVIYKISRAPDRRVFYIDVGNLPKQKAEQYLNDVMTKYRNKIVYDSATGEVRDDRKNLSMIEDYWLPRREGSRGTEIDTLPGGTNLGEMENVMYFKKNLYMSLSIPISRLEPKEGFSLGRSSEITRDELKFTKFIQRLRNKFSTLFDDLMRIQLVMKGVCTAEEWDEFKEKIYYDYLKDNMFNELKETELLTSRIQLLNMIDPYIGRFYSATWVRKNVLQQSDEDIDEMDKQIEEEQGTAAAQSPFQMQQDQMEQQEQQMKLDKGQQKIDMANAMNPPQQQLKPAATFDPVNADINNRFAGLRMEDTNPINNTIKIIKESSRKKAT